MMSYSNHNSPLLSNCNKTSHLVEFWRYVLLTHSQHSWGEIKHQKQGLSKKVEMIQLGSYKPQHNRQTHTVMKKIIHLNNLPFLTECEANLLLMSPCQYHQVKLLHVCYMTNEAILMLTYIQPPKKGFEVFHTLINHSK